MEYDRFMLPEKEIQCPYCWERYPIVIDDSEGQELYFVYDCEVCCRPIDVCVQITEGQIRVRTARSGGMG
jgi:hypothetical protein